MNDEQSYTIKVVDSEHSVQITSRCNFELAGVIEPIRQSAWGNPDRLFRPRTADATVVDGEVQRILVTGPRINKAGDGADHTREWMSWELDNDMVPEFVRQLADTALASHPDKPELAPAKPCDGEVVATYTIYDDGVHLECQACKWTKPLGFSPPVRLMGQETRHEAVSA
jgi:hypothetical protein